MGLSRHSSRKRAEAEPQAASLPVVIGSGSHPFPFRTRKLSLIPPMVLHGKLCGRVGRCRHYSLKSPRGFENLAGFSFVRAFTTRVTSRDRARSLHVRRDARTAPAHRPA